MLCHGCQRNQSPMPGMLCSSCGGNFYSMPAGERKELIETHLRGFPDDAEHVHAFEFVQAGDAKYCYGSHSIRPGETLQHPDGVTIAVDELPADEPTLRSSR